MPKKQDFRLEEVNIGKFTFVEIQNNVYADPPIEIRATEYSVLSISQNPGKVSNQIWLLAGDVQKLIPSGAFSNYVPRDEVSGVVYPNASGIMFVSLKKLSQENTVAGELASFLLGKTNDVINKEVRQIADTLKKSCEEFCINKEVKKSMSVADELRMEGRVEGRVETLRELSELINSGMSAEDALQRISEETNVSN